MFLRESAKCSDCSRIGSGWINENVVPRICVHSFVICLPQFALLVCVRQMREKFEGSHTQRINNAKCEPVRLSARRDKNSGPGSLTLWPCLLYNASEFFSATTTTRNLRKRLPRRRRSGEGGGGDFGSLLTTALWHIGTCSSKCFKKRRYNHLKTVSLF